MTERTDRPDSLKRAPRPASDHGVHPVDYRSTAPDDASRPNDPRASESAESAPNPSGTLKKVAAKKRDRAIPFSTRLTEDVLQLLDDVTTSRGITYRQAVEDALRHTYGQGL